uniref:DNA/RNA-binding protein Kin17 WH-like domain-containing protein n=1 Tax=Rhizochromulina marina TaxID=1034831 RepID=A0A6U0Y7K8_9STRA|mmetsp:Transcript_16140/g.47377  ORF Transcript_16140/g.47377 Transcript_16140/m.47377 type:complete len:401 (+) Transcript_16140:266-1468(+)
MPKHGFLTPKAIGNRIKAKGLQKLRWYCEMCQKQCRDENGFKCHQTSEGHLRQMRIYADNPGKVMDQYSKEFEEYFLETLSRHHNTKRVHANLVYKEYIGDKHHVHMNATKWTTLTNFVLYLGKTGKVVADETEKGWYIQWIDRDPAVVARQQAAEKKRKHEMDDEARRQKEVARRVQAAGAAEEPDAPQASELSRGAPDEKVSLQLGKASTATATVRSAKKPRLGASSAFGDAEVVDDGPKAGAGLGSAKPKFNAMQALMQQEEKRKQASLVAEEKQQRKDYWLHTGIVVKVINKKLAEGKYYKGKGDVVKVIDKYVGVVEMHHGGDRLQLDQDDVETVIPNQGGRVRILNGRGRGCIGEVVRIDIDKFAVSVRVLEGDRRGQTLDNIVYEDVSKVASA